MILSLSSADSYGSSSVKRAAPGATGRAGALLLENLPKAKEHLARLDSLCFLPCSEYSDLKRAVQAYESSGGKVKPTGH